MAELNPDHLLQYSHDDVDEPVLVALSCPSCTVDDLTVILRVPERGVSLGELAAASAAHRCVPRRSEEYRPGDVLDFYGPAGMNDAVAHIDTAWRVLYATPRGQERWGTVIATVRHADGHCWAVRVLPDGEDEVVRVDRMLWRRARGVVPVREGTENREAVPSSEDDYYRWALDSINCYHLVRPDWLATARCGRAVGVLAPTEPDPSDRQCMSCQIFAEREKS